MQVTSRDMNGIRDALSSMFPNKYIDIAYHIRTHFHFDGEQVQERWALYVDDDKWGATKEFHNWESLRAYVHGLDTEDTVLITEGE